jgi:NADH-quinone oxidoreductase subunit L
VGRVMAILFARAPIAHAHGLAPSMAGPLVALAIPAAAAGLLAGPFTALVGRPAAFHLGAAGSAAAVLALVGLAGAWIADRRGLRPAAVLGRLIDARPIDRLYELVYARVLVAVSRAAAWFDRYVVDGVMNGVAVACLAAGRRLRVVQTGNAQDYLLAVVAGAVALVVWGIL